MNSFDVAVLGGGPGGYVAAIRSAQLGLNTVIIEKAKLGGICLNWGCIPTKTLLKNAEALHIVKTSKKFGINIPKYSVDFPSTIKRSRDVADRLSKGIAYLIKKNKITHYEGTGKLITPKILEVVKGKKKQNITAKKIIIATGGRPQSFPGMKLDGKRIISSKEAMVLNKIPKKLIVIGSGAIGVEFAYFFNEYGSEVHLIEMLPRILPVEDEAVSKELARNFKKSKIKIYTETKVSKIDSLKSKVKVYLDKKGKQNILEGDLALVAVGVTGNVENIGLDDLGVKVKKGSIVINKFNQTNVENIYAIGDVTGPPWLAHVASAQGHVAAEHAAGRKPVPVDYTNIPGCTYCQPQVASIGLTEVEAKEKNYDVKVGKFDFKASGKALASGHTDGFVKLIFDAKYGELLGAHIIGSEATELIAELGMAKALESTWDELATTTHAHPTLSEAVMEAALDAMGQGVHQ
ncbi:MAG: dihydrolipoyl dehydrogenase [Candidatus Marinimicrobia bacterium]|jgi:dihydrolipoamide dehydrogenase|nr:dihydrolipoyl dehydrogenase [Candidatus Neomarinimicrobiota bacterium]MBT3618712.1 dihydrolipoyl dehydrogenase [Candidatus Neomarinimicrobiota bacterium]MBT3828279.1 dihydrolipoyl dehydrogenase [Candidatus Neomarinimicrobiota bacterium]MBT3997260.1 dihydrolipoyl dehydrogenase [Candidatus Neomarinimicrobiota bacterium]MBT4280142.1 dihydrolipoyl dehydrogenase [Candidatus Neomarinimicrobiota bacterium]